MEQVQPLWFKSMGDIPWQEYPGHFGSALSKELVGPQQSHEGARLCVGATRFKSRHLESGARCACVFCHHNASC